MALAVERDLPGQLLDEPRTFGPRPNQAHVATQNVPQLRNLVEPGLAHEAADRRNARVLVAGAPHRAGARLGVGAHRAELVNGERRAVEADALLVIEDRVAR